MQLGIATEYSDPFQMTTTTTQTQQAARPNTSDQSTQCDATLKRSVITGVAAVAIKPVAKYSIIVDKSEGEKLGIKLGGGDSTKVGISVLNPTGLLPSWNEDNPHNIVQQQDCIVKVNGVSGDAKKILLELKKNQSLLIKFERGTGLALADREPT
jgi:hypothetical protein